MALIAFDFDGTLSDDEMLVLLAEQYGVAADVEDITERAMRGELAYAESLRERAALLDGLPEAEAEAAYEQVYLRPGAADLIESLRDAGHTVVILTGGFEEGVQAALEKENVEVDAITANSLPVEDGHLTGEVEGPLIEGTKDDALDAAMTEFGIDRADTIAVGDGANDLPMLERAGRAVGFLPKPNVRPECDLVVARMDVLHEVFAEDGLIQS
ncbi:phosphoserine phosphatase SerB [Salarchaeum japonicum]|uniref:phosphoserine phosphatase n=1 Tax=Salarchaeum japonicum TaxID=555573 RepID=A0AAV3SZB2_9EURY|nr:phosphoserine phosphatase SerB [Salarchaeum japonicum]